MVHHTNEPAQAWEAPEQLAQVLDLYLTLQPRPRDVERGAR
jgi:hypothetical protein